MSWSRGGWRNAKPSPHIPEYPDPAQLRAAEDLLKSWPPLVFAGEIRQLKREIARVAQGEAFMLQGGDCAETFSGFNTFTIRDTFRVLLQMAAILTFVGEKPVVRVGRVAGQFAKPRSRPTETVDGIELPAYRGDMINSPEPVPEARRPDPQRMSRAYFQSAATLNLLRAFAGGGYADPHLAGQWLLEFVDHSAVREKYDLLVRQIDKTLNVMRAYRDPDETVFTRRVDFFCAHEALFLPYEEALCRQDSLGTDIVAASAHFLWLGERTRDPDSPQAEFLSGVVNPLGVKCGPTTEGPALERVLDKLDPNNEPGKITLILRAGVDKADRAYTRLIREIQAAGRRVAWIVDPMHGNPRRDGEIKTRYFSDILHECKIFIDVCRAERVHPGGLHLELTGKNVTECLGGSDGVVNLSSRYETGCDPRLNASQSLELAFAVAEHLARK